MKNLKALTAIAAITVFVVGYFMMLDGTDRRVPFHKMILGAVIMSSGFMAFLRINPRYKDDALSKLYCVLIFTGVLYVVLTLIIARALHSADFMRYICIGLAHLLGAKFIKSCLPPGHSLA